MWDCEGKHFYIFELTGLADGRVVIPIRWIIRNGEGSADAVEVIYDQEVSVLLSYQRHARGGVQADNFKLIVKLLSPAR